MVVVVGVVVVDVRLLFFFCFLRKLAVALRVPPALTPKQHKLSGRIVGARRQAFQTLRVFRLRALECRSVTVVGSLCQIFV